MEVERGAVLKSIVRSKERSSAVQNIWFVQVGSTRPPDVNESSYILHHEDVGMACRIIRYYNMNYHNIGIA